MAEQTVKEKETFFIDLGFTKAEVVVDQICGDNVFFHVITGRYVGSCHHRLIEDFVSSFVTEHYEP